LVRLLLAVLLAGSCAAQTGVVTYHNDNARTGVYSNEILLTPASIQSGMFGKRYSIALDGAVYAQPLYLSRVKIAGQGLRNVFFVATSHDSLYAFDADDQSGFSAQPLWRVNFLDPANGVTTVSQTDVNCPVIAELGISGTPVIDPASGTIYLIAETKEAGSKFVFRLHAIDVTSGSERPGSPVEIQPQGFVPVAHKQRTGLLLSNGVVYSTWSGHCDRGTYHGWVMAHDTATLGLVGAFNDSPGGSGASFWNGGAGPSADANGNIYSVTANGDFDGNTSLAEYDESVLKLTPAPALSVSDIFTPFDKLALDEKDLDLGSSGAIVLPDDAGSPAHPHLLFTSGKEGRMYLLDRENLGGVQTGSDSGAVASLPALSSNATFGMSAYFHGTIYIAPENSPMFSFPLSGGSLAFSPSAQTSTVNGLHGATPSISSNGARDGVVWVVSVNDGGKLLAYDAAGLSQLYDSSLNPADAVPGYIEFAGPTVADGRVYVGAGLGIAVYGQLASTVPVVAAVANAASYSTDAISPGSLISLFGAGLAATTSAAEATPLPLSMADTSVTINGLVAPLLFVSPRQINAQVPSGISPGLASVVVRKEGALSTPVMIHVHAAAPGVFTDGQGRAAAIDPDGLPNSAMNAAPAGEFVSLYFTGLGPVAAPVEDGAAPSAGETITATSPISATIGGLPAEIQFAGLAPLYPGVAQLNLKVPALASGIYPLVISVGGSASNSVPLAISSH
jgi:uncharacterized protein (TIGR03437 family)